MTKEPNFGDFRIVQNTITNNYRLEEYVFPSAHDYVYLDIKGCWKQIACHPIYDYLMKLIREKEQTKAINEAWTKVVYP